MTTQESSRPAPAPLDVVGPSLEDPAELLETLLAERFPPLRRRPTREKAA